MPRTKKVTADHEPIDTGDAEVNQWVEDVWSKLVESGNEDNLTYEEAARITVEKISKYAERDLSAYLSKQETKVPEPEPEPETPLVEVEFNLPTIDTDPYWYEDPTDAKVIDHFIKARRAEGSRVQGGLLITGPAGEGKTHGILRHIEALGLDELKMDCATVTDEGKWFGRRDLINDGNGASHTEYIPSDFIVACQTGKVIILDEITRLHPRIWNNVHPLLDASRAVHLSDLNVTINVHPQTVFLATANMGSQFGGTYRMDWATRERFSVTVEMKPKPEAETKRILMTHTTIDEDAARNLVRIGMESRTLYDNGDIRSPISTRTMVNAAMLVSWGFSELQALEFTAIPLYDGNADGQVGEKSDRDQVRKMIEGVMKRR